MPKPGLTILFIIIFLRVQCQDMDTLRLEVPESAVISNVFNLQVSDKDAHRILSSSGRKIQLKTATLLFNGDTLPLKSVKTRGKSSLNFRRKSISVSLHSPINLGNTQIKKFALVGMVMDKNYWRNRFSFLMLSKFNLFPLYNTYVEFRINNQTEGVYLLVQKAEDYCHQIQAPLLVRREYQGDFEIEYSNGKEGNYLNRKLRKGRDLSNFFKGVQLADSLDQLMDIDQYYRWLAFNFLTMNGDYADEVFFYFDSSMDRFKIIPWDYDDLFAPQPHEGWEQRKQNIGHNLLYSGEAYLDRVIDSDPYLYSQYLRTFNDFIVSMEKEVLASFQQVYKELYPYYQKKDIIGQSVYDHSGETNLELLEWDLKKHYMFLQQRIKATQRDLESHLKTF